MFTGAAPRPIIDILAETKHWRLLQCEAHGDPLPTVEWKDSDDNTLPAEEPQISERGGRLYITVNVTVTKTGNYSCVATQETLSHQVAANTSVYIHGKILSSCDFIQLNFNFKCFTVSAHEENV